MKENKTSIRTKYFANLDGLRFVAFFMVFLSHGFGYNDYISVFSKNGYFSLFKEHLLYAGSMGVELFFVLSGFLITYLLLYEKNEFENIKIKNFYIRRILRIWPVYFFVVIFGIFISSNIKIFPIVDSVVYSRIHYFFLFLVNLILAKGIYFSPILGVLWSVSIEEQFYLIWPILVKFANGKIFPMLAFSGLIFSELFKYKHANNFEIFHYHTFSAISFLILGSLSAYYAFYSPVFLNIFKNISKIKIVFIYLLGLMTFFAYGFNNPNGAYNNVFQILDSLVLGIFYCFIILEQNYAKNSLFKIGKMKNLTKLGKYTYALYCLHLFAIYITIYLFKVIGFHNINEPNIFEYLLEFFVALILAIGISILSYKYFESYFLKLKSKFVII